MALYYWLDNFSRTCMHMYAHFCDAWRHEVCFKITPTHMRKRSVWQCKKQGCKSIRDVSIDIEVFIGLRPNLRTFFFRSHYPVVSARDVKYRSTLQNSLLSKIMGYRALKLQRKDYSRLSCQNITNLLSIINVETCFDSQIHHQANYWTMFKVHQVKVHIFGIPKCLQR